MERGITILQWGNYLQFQHAAQLSANYLKLQKNRVVQQTCKRRVKITWKIESPKTMPTNFFEITAFGTH